VPFVFWFWKIVFTPVHGYGLTFQSGYNKIVLDPLGFIKGYFKLFKGIRAPFLKITLNPIVPVLSFMLVALLYFGLKLKWHQQFRDRRQFPYVLIFGILLLFAGSFPYVAVGKNFGGGFGIGWGGYGSRNQLLLGIPMAMILVSLSCLILGPRSRRRFNVIFLLTLIVTFSVFRIHLYLTWQAEAIKQHSTLYNLSQLSQAKDIHVFGILDRYPIAEENTMLWWGIAFKKVFGDFTRFGFYEGFVQGTPDLAGYYSFKGGIAHWYSLEDLSHLITGFQTNVYPKHFNPTGRQATLIIDRGPFESEVELVGKYYFYKYLRRAELNRFLSEVTRLSLIERFPPKG